MDDILDDMAGREEVVDAGDLTNLLYLSSLKICESEETGQFLLSLSKQGRSTGCLAVDGC